MGYPALHVNKKQHQFVQCIVFERQKPSKDIVANICLNNLVVKIQLKTNVFFGRIVDVMLKHFLNDFCKSSGPAVAPD